MGQRKAIKSRAQPTGQKSDSPRSTGERRPDFHRQWLIPLLIAGAALYAYSNSFSGSFVFDDIRAIPDNRHIRQLWPLSEAMAIPPQTAISGRPVVSLTLALNYALGGLDVWGYHAFNLAIHILAALALFGIIRRTLASMKQGDSGRSGADWLAAAVSLIWVVHPLLSESVVYIIQRTELLMGLFLLLTLYFFIRGVASARPVLWYCASVVSCGLGMASKEVMIGAPVLVLLYDWLFLTGSVRASLRRRWGVYAGLAATWSILAMLMAGKPRANVIGMGFANLTPWQYLMTQSGVIVHYLRLSLWPDGLCADYFDWPVAFKLTSVLWQAGLILALLAATSWALWRRRWPGYLGAWCFLILAPTSSIVPILTEIAAERRMYLPLIAVVGVAVIGVHVLLARYLRKPALRRVELALLVSVVLAFGFMMREQSKVYADELTLFSDIVAKRPNNARAQNNLGIALAREKRLAEAEMHFERALAIWPKYAEAHNNLGAALYSEGRVEESLPRFMEAVRLNPDYVDAQLNLGLALHNQGRIEEAIAHYSETLRLDPGNAEAYKHRGAALLSLGRIDEATVNLREAKRLGSDQGKPPATPKP